MIVVTTPTGDIGHQVLAKLSGTSESIRVIARDPSRVPMALRERVEVVQGSHRDTDVVDRAFKGADSVFWLVPPDPLAKSVESAYVDFTRPACEAIKRHAVKRVVDIAPLGRGLPAAEHAGHVTASLAMDDLLTSTGVHFRALTMPSFMDNILRQAGPIRTKGMFFSAIDGDRKLPACATRDIAAAAVKLLLDLSWAGQGHVAVLGPEDLSFNDMARIMSETLGKTVRYQQISLDAYKANFVKLGMSEAMAQGMTDMARAKNEGVDNAEPRTPENTTPTTFRQWCGDVLKPAVLGQS